MQTPNSDKIINVMIVVAYINRRKRKRRRFHVTKEYMLSSPTHVECWCSVHYPTSNYHSMYCIIQNTVNLSIIQRITFVDIIFTANWTIHIHNMESAVNDTAWHTESRKESVLGDAAIDCCVWIEWSMSNTSKTAWRRLSRAAVTFVGSVSVFSLYFGTSSPTMGDDVLCSLSSWKLVWYKSHTKKMNAHEHTQNSKK